MTDTTPAPHLDLDTLADVLAQEAPPEATEHLGSCSSCASRLAELDAAESRVIAVLAMLPPPAVPADLSSRLTAALAAERPLAEGRSSVTALPERAAPPGRWLPAAAAGVVLFAGAGLGYALLSGSGGNDSDRATSAQDSAGGATAGLVLNASGTDYSDAAAVTGALPEVLRGAAGEVMLAERSVEAQTEGGSSSGNEDTAAEPAPASALSAGDPLERLRTTEGLADCLAALLPPEEPETAPLALDYATYAGAPALAVVLPDPDPAKLSIFVVGPGCSQADDSTLHFVRVDAP